jgi:tetratricopeptide (TPR) repeat protein
MVSDKALPLIWNVPHLRNLYFTGREDILTYLHKTFSTKKTVALTQPHAINGLGGIGKTQIAIEYAYRYCEEYKAVLWVHADSHELLVSDFISAAGLLNLPEKNESDQNIVIRAVMGWLQRNPDWLLILDNADNIEIASKFLPTGGKGNILLTTRSQATGKNIKAIEIEKMLPEEGVFFLLRRAKVLDEDTSVNTVSDRDKNDAKAIYDLLDGLPLALDQAAAYIEENRSSLQDYLTLYHTHRYTLLKRRGSFSQLDYPQSVATTWLLSFKQVEQNNPASAELLRLCAFLHPDAIPEEIIETGSVDLGPILQSIVGDPIQVADAIGELRKYSLIRRNPDTKTLIIHRLVQVITKDQMNEDLQRAWVERVVRLVESVFPRVKYETWPFCQRYLPHAQICATQIEQWAMKFPEATQLLDKVGFYLQERAQYIQVEPLYRQALTIREQILGPEHPDVAQSLNNLAEFYRIQGKYTQAVPLYQRALTIREQILGPEHLDVATILSSLAGLYRAQGKHTQAEPLQQRALTIREQILGPEHPDVSHSLNHLGLLYDTQGKYFLAEPLYTRALTIREQILGPEHPDVAQSLNNLALLYYNQGKYDQAEPLYTRALTIRQKALGPNHPHTARCLSNLAKLYLAQGKCTQSELLFKQALVHGGRNPSGV